MGLPGLGGVPGQRGLRGHCGWWRQGPEVQCRPRWVCVMWSQVKEPHPIFRIFGGCQGWLWSMLGASEYLGRVPQSRRLQRKGRGLHPSHLMCHEGLGHPAKTSDPPDPPCDPSGSCGSS